MLKKRPCEPFTHTLIGVTGGAEGPCSGSRSQSANVAVQAGDKEGKGAKKLDEDTVNGVGKEPKPVDSMPNSTVEKEGARTGEVLAGKPAVCEEASKMEVDTAAVAAQAINNSAADTVRCCSCLLYL